jgi:DNA excision repair protein ERCC-2
VVRKIQLSARQFAIPAPRIGSIETHSGYGTSPFSGQEIHSLIQENRVREVPGYIPEKWLTYSFEKAPYAFVVSGRADGFKPGTPAFFEEIKTAFDIRELYDKLRAEPNHPYVWQLRTYGYIHYLQTNEVPELKLHLVSSRNFKALDIVVDLDVPDFEAWLERRLNELVLETQMKEKLFKKRQKTADELVFPFPQPRPGQRELIGAIESAFAQQTPLMIQAPTGLGKTVGVLYPALKDALARGQKVVYVTPKNTQHQAVEEAVELLHEKGSALRALTLTAKSKMCFKAEMVCNPDHCEFAKDYYQKVSEHQLLAKVNKLRGLSAKKLKKIGDEFQVCPFELSVEAIELADIVIGDYNYAFAPRGLQGRLCEPLMKPQEKPNLVIDEAHNLPARAQDYFSPVLSTNELRFLQEAFRLLAAPFAALGEELAAAGIALIQSYGGAGPAKIEIDPEPFLELGQRIRDFTLKYLESDEQIRPLDPVLKLSNLWSNFVESFELMAQPEFFQSYQRNHQGEMLKVTCCDASAHLKTVYQAFKNTVAFSATLKPFHYYQTLMGLTAPTVQTQEFPSPFPKEHRKILLIPQISTKYNDRARNAPKIAEVIQRVIALKPGNYLALFPSFEFLNLARQHLHVPEFQVLVQGRDMKPGLTQNYLDELKYSERPTLLLGVQGGVFSEGVDYAGDMLIGAFVVGPALPNFDFEREQIRAYYDRAFGKEQGFDFAYVFPAMAKAVQSAGRVIRSEKDRGVIILMDPRFLQASYAQSMPEGWFKDSPQELISQGILQDVTEFWARDGAAAAVRVAPETPNPSPEAPV